MNQERIGKFILQLRKEKNMTQKELADKLGVTDRAISKWENGRGLPELSLMSQLCEELDVSLNEFLSGERIAKEEYQEKLEENIINTIEYADGELARNTKIVKVLLLILLVATVAVGWLLYDRMFPYVDAIPQIEAEQMKSLSVSDKDENEILLNETELELLVTYINHAEPTRTMSVNESPRVNFYYQVDLPLEKWVMRYLIYEEDGACYVEIPYNGVWKVDKGIMYILEK